MEGSEKSPPMVLHTRVVTGGGGGPDKTILNSPRFLRELGYQSVCVFMHPPDDPGFESIRQRAADAQAPIESVPDRGIWDLSVLLKLLKICRKHRVAIWHGHDYKSNLFGLLLRPFHRMRLVTTVHGWVRYTKRTPLYYWIDRVCLRRYEVVICVSEDLVERCKQIGVPSERCVLVPNAIDTEQFRRRQSVEEAKRSLGWPIERLLVGGVGRLSEEKGFDLLIRAISALHRKGHDVGLALVGEGDQFSELTKLARDLGIADRVHFAGFQVSVSRYFEAMDIYALSSIREGLPNVVLEAMAFEVPVVATRVAGIPNLVEDEVNGLVIPPGEVEPLENAIRKLLLDKALRQKIGREGRRTVETSRGFRQRMENIAALYDHSPRADPIRIIKRFVF